MTNQVGAVLVALALIVGGCTPFNAASPSDMGASPTSTGSPSASTAATASNGPTASGAPSSSAPSGLAAGAPCRTVGERLKNDVGWVECRWVAQQQRHYVQLLGTPQPPGFTATQAPLSTCRLQGAPIRDGAIAFPASADRIPQQGKVSVALIPIDFSDAPGVGSPNAIIDPIIANVNDWLRHFSNGKVEYLWQTSDQWIRASKPSTEYVWDHPENDTGGPAPGAVPVTPREAIHIGQDLLEDADALFDYTDVKVVFFIYPKDIVNIWDAMTTWSVGQTDEGRINYQLNATGAWLYRGTGTPWAWFLHENLHPHGLAGHAPNDGSPFGIMTNESNFALQAWDTLILGWDVPGQFFCASRNVLKSADVVLSPIDRTEQGTKAILVKLSDYEVLVVESRRRSDWSGSPNRGQPVGAAFPKGFYGLLVYKVNLLNRSNRVWEPWAYKWTGDSKAFAYYIPNRSVTHEMVSGQVEGFSWIDSGYVTYLGETLVTDGVAISLITSGDVDTVRVAPASP